jgi:hypothetical protein
MRKGAHYNKHPKRLTIGHWLAAYGYSDGGARVSFVDSSTSAPGFEKAKPRYSARTATFTATYLQRNGMAW